MANIEKGKTYIGVVEDINDPKKIGRVKVRVLDVFDDTKIEDIPWATPWKDLGGNEFNVPDVGKVVTVVFDNANQNSPEFISSDHYNINLEKKLSQLSSSDYSSMKSLLFDHKTQIYVNDSEGLKLDHKFNMLNIKDKSINVNLKDNFSKINLGTANSTQRSILGDNFLNWFDDFLKILLGGDGGAFLGNLMSPVTPTPALLESVYLYQSLRDPKFLSKNVYIVDNECVEKLDRISEGQKGDVWQSTVKENNITTKEPVTFKPTPGSTDTTFDQPKVNASTQSQASTQVVASKPSENPDIKIIKKIIDNKKYKLYEDVNKLNIISVRNQCISIGDKYTDQFVDKLFIMFKTEDGSWVLKQYSFSTVPGLEFTITDSWLGEKKLTNLNPWIGTSGKKIFMKEYAKTIGTINNDPILKNGLPILVPSQYIDLYYMDTYRGEMAMKTVPGASQLVWRDSDTTNIDTFNPSNFTSPELIKPTDIIDNSIKIHLGYPGGQKVGNWSEGSQVFSNSDSLKEFFSYCEKHKSKWGNKFTYTLVTKKDWEEATQDMESDKTGDILTPKQTTPFTIEDKSISSLEITPSRNKPSVTQSSVEILVQTNKSETIDVNGDKSLNIDIFTQDVILTGKITTDDITRLSNEIIKFSIKSPQLVPNDWQMVSGEISYTDPTGSGNGVLSIINNDNTSYDILNKHIKNGSVGDYKFDFKIYLFRRSTFEQTFITKSLIFKIESGSVNSFIEFDNTLTQNITPTRVVKK